jgi:hypothetical protein
VFYVNIPVCLLALGAAFRLLLGERMHAPLADFDTQGAVLGTVGMLLLVYALVKAPDIGWGTTRTIGTLAAAAAILLVFVIDESRHRNPLLDLSIFRIKGLAAADATWLIGMAGFFAMFFFLTLYMQEVLNFSPIQAGAAYVPVTACLALASGVCSQLFARIGTRPVIVVGALLGAGGIYYLSRIPLDGSYATDILPGLVVMTVGFGAVFVGVTTAAKRRRAGQQSRAGRRPPEHLAAARDGARAGRPLGDRHPTHRSPARRPRDATGGAHRGLSASAVGVPASSSWPPR